LSLTTIVAVLTFVLQQRLPYRRMLITTGILLGVVLLVMVGEQVQEMQLANWIPKTDIPWLAGIPAWMGMWFAVFPNYEGLIGQALAAVLVIGSYYAARYFQSSDNFPFQQPAEVSEPQRPIIERLETVS
jgi:high-affinity iron transporter